MKLSKLKRTLKKQVLKLPHIKAKRKRYLKMIRSSYDYTQKAPTILCSTCIGGMISHNLGLQFMSPTVNLWLTPSDFVKFVSNLNKYLTADFRFIESSQYDYPVGRLEDITIYFQHYINKEEAERKWSERKKRIDLKNLYIITDDKRLSDEEIECLLSVPCKRLIIFTNEPERGKNFFCLGCYKGLEEIGLYSVRDLYGFAPFEKEFQYAAWLSGCEDFRVNAGKNDEC